MAGQNDFLIFDENQDNMLTQENYAIDSDRTDGFQTGLARSNVTNKVLHQTSMMCHAIGEVAKDYDLVATDGGTIADLKNVVKQALGGADKDLSNLTATGETHFANKSLSNLNTDAHFNVLRPLIHSRMKITSAGVMATWGSRTFSKAYDDECIGAVVVTASGYGSICLVSETERGAMGYDGYNTTPRVTGTFTYYGKTFYYFVSDYAIPIAEGLVKNNNLIPVCPHRLSGSENIASVVLDMAYTNIRYSIPEATYVSGTWGYRLWGDGWKEFWGRATTTSAGQQLTITTPIGMNNSQYALVIQQLRGSTGNDAYPHITAINATNFSFKGDSNAENIWYACGY